MIKNYFALKFHGYVGVLYWLENSTLVIDVICHVENLIYNIISTCQFDVKLTSQNMSYLVQKLMKIDQRLVKPPLCFKPCSDIDVWHQYDVILTSNCSLGTHFLSKHVHFCKAIIFQKNTIYKNKFWQFT